MHIPERKGRVKVLKPERKFRIVGVGGTFDELHKGHRKLLVRAFEVSDTVWIGLCTDSFAKKLRKNHYIAPYGHRLEELRNFLCRSGYLERAKITSLSDPYGPTISDEKIEAIVVSQETEPVAYAINAMRKRNRLPPLEILVINMVPAQNHIRISTTRIRNGETDREGKMLRK